MKQNETNDCDRMRGLRPSGAANWLRFFVFHMTTSRNPNGRGFNSDRAAMVLVDAAFTNDLRAAKKHGVSDRAIREWRERLETDDVLATKFRMAYDNATNNWASRLNGAIIAGVEFLHNAALEADHKNPDMVAAIGEAWGKLVEARMTVDLLNARLSTETPAVGQEDGSLAGQAGATETNGGGSDTSG